MIRTYTTIILIILTVITLTAAALKPKLYKPVQFVLTDFKVENTVNAERKSLKVEIPSEQTSKTEEKTIKLQPQSEEKTTKIIQSQNTKPVQKTITTSKVEQTKNVMSVKQSAAPQQSKTVQTTLPQSQIKLPPSIQQTINKTETIKTVTQPKVKQTTQPKEIEIENKPLTAQEEIIVWNKWRSDLQNKIMRDSKVHAPLGTTFKFSFTVDRAGRISNLRVWSNTPAYNTIAINMIKPVILGYQGTSILNFPPRTKRIITNVNGGFVISTSNKFSSPCDFSDIEKVRN